jgi:hypothetical protein
LPTALNDVDPFGPGLGFNITGSEMGHLYYTELGNEQLGGISNTGDFQDLINHVYWTSTESATLDNIWVFYLDVGAQGEVMDDRPFYSLAVRDGDVLDLNPASTYPTSELIDNGDDTITQIKGDGSKLMWAKDTMLSGSLKTWADATEWVRNLTLAEYNDWRLPIFRGSPTTSDLGYMYYVELGNQLDGIGGINAGPFNMTVDAYNNVFWTGSETDPDNVRSVNFSTGRISSVDKQEYHQSWAVRDITQDGATGAKGDPGTDGQDGADGATGPKGTDGQDGADGATGPKGTDGQDGADGITPEEVQDMQDQIKALVVEIQSIRDLLPQLNKKGKK